MKFLKIQLADGKNYTLTTFSLLEFTVMRKEHKKYNDLEDEQDRINFETDDNGKKKKDPVTGKWIFKENKTDKELERLEEIETEVMNFGIDVIRKSLSKRHEEFKKIGEKQKDQEVIEKVMGLIDVADLRKFINFIFTGNYPREDMVIDLTIGESDLVDEEKK